MKRFAVFTLLLCATLITTEDAHARRKNRRHTEAGDSSMMVSSPWIAASEASSEGSVNSSNNTEASSDALVLSTSYATVEARANLINGVRAEAIAIYTSISSDRYDEYDKDSAIANRQSTNLRRALQLVQSLAPKQPNAELREYSPYNALQIIALGCVKTYSLTAGSACVPLSVAN